MIPDPMTGEERTDAAFAEDAVEIHGDGIDAAMARPRVGEQLGDSAYGVARVELRDAHLRNRSLGRSTVRLAS